MTAEDPGPTGPWGDPSFVAAWVDQDRRRTLLDLPRRVAAAVVANEDLQVRLVVDVAAGAGAFLAVLLERFPMAQGVWFDTSSAMEEQARARLGHLAERIRFVLGDMRDLAPLELTGAADLVVSSRASHHLDEDELGHFYADCAGLCASGGWIANLDHVGTETAWNRRWRLTRAEIAAGEPTGVPHPHREPLPSLEAHLGSVAAAGFVDVDVPWRLLQTALVMGRMP